MGAVLKLRHQDATTFQPPAQSVDISRHILSHLWLPGSKASGVLGQTSTFDGKAFCEHLRMAQVDCLLGAVMLFCICARWFVGIPRTYNSPHLLIILYQPGGEDGEQHDASVQLPMCSGTVPEQRPLPRPYHLAPVGLRSFWRVSTPQGHDDD